jgi:hypothetical protein
MKARIVILLVLFLLVAAPASAEIASALSAGHTVTFQNTCKQPVWINLQGGPKGVCDGVIDPNTHKLKACSACSLCDGGGLCNTSAATGDTKPMCCPGIVQEKKYCWNGDACSTGCCPGVPKSFDLTYPCPGAGADPRSCGVKNLTRAQIENLSGYKNPINNLSHLVCNGSIISNGGFKLNASGESRSFVFEKGWQGAFYPRTNCTFVNGIGNCETGNCKDTNGNGVLECGGAGSIAPVTKGEFNFDDTIDWYDVSWVDGFNIAVVIQPARYDPTFPSSDPAHHCSTAGCSVGLSSFTSPAVPNWSVLKYPSVNNFGAILSDCNLYTNLLDSGILPRNAMTNRTLAGYCCPIAEGYVNDSSISCANVPAGKTCKTCAGQNNKLFPFNQPAALPNSAKLFYHTCPTAYAYTYNDTDALMTCRGNSSLSTDYKVTLSCPAPALKVGIPNGGANWTRGSTHTITWRYTGNPGSKVKIELLRGTTVNRVIKAATSIGTGGLGSYTWKIPYNQVPGKNYKIQITSTSNAAYTDKSNSDFTISAGAPITVLDPNGGQNWIRGSTHTITWRYTGSPGSSVKVELLRGTTVKQVINPGISIGSGGSGSSTWNIPSSQAAGSDYRIQITSTSNAANTDKSNANFTISAS